MRLLLRLFVLSLLILPSGSMQAQVVHQESFDSLQFTPPNWSLTNIVNPGWVRRTTGPTGANILPHSGPGMARYTVANTPPGTQQGLVTPVINYSGITANDTARFSMWMYRDSLSTLLDSITIYVNTSPDITGATRLGVIARSRYSVLPQNELLNGWYHYTYDIPASFNTDTNYVILYGTTQGGSNMFVDDVEWNEFPVQCNGQPVAGTVAVGDTLICGGSGATDLVLSSPSASFAGISFTWQYSSSDSGPWTDFGNSSTLANTGTINATTYYRAIVNCSNSGLMDSTQAVEVVVSQDPLPVITTSGNVSYCNGSSPVLVTVSGAMDYTWSPANGLDVTVGDSVYASPGNPTSYTVTGTDASGCSSTANVIVNVSNAPNFNAFSNRSMVCEGDTTALRAQNLGGPGFGNQYSWTPGGMVGNNVPVTITAPITYYVTATNTAGCTAEDSVFIDLAPAVDGGFSYSANGLTITFQDTSNGATSWIWSFGDGNASFNSSPTYTYSSPGVYIVTLVVSNGVCTPDTISTSLTVTATALGEVSATGNSVLLPNPANDKSRIIYKSDARNGNLSVINADGRLVFEKQIISQGGYFTEELDVSVLNSGVYFVKIETENGFSIQRLIRQ